MHVEENDIVLIDSEWNNQSNHGICNGAFVLFY